MKEEDFDLIDAALRDQLTLAERSAFDARLANDVAFRQDYEETKLMIHAAKELGRERLRVEIVTQQPARGIIQWPVQRVLALAATILLITVTGIWLYSTRENGLFDQYYASYETLSLNTPRGDASVYEINVRALELYRKHQPAAAIELLKTALAINSTDEDAILLMGLCYLELRKFKQSLEWLQKIGSGDDDAIRWYTALAYLGADEPQSADLLLKEIIHRNSSAYSGKALELVKKLKEN